MKPYIDLAPGPETWEGHRVWQGCPTIARTRGGRLFAGWYTGGLFEPCIRNFNVLVKSDDGGESWLIGTHNFKQWARTRDTGRETRMGSRQSPLTSRVSSLVSSSEVGGTSYRFGVCQVAWRACNAPHRAGARRARFPRSLAENRRQRISRARPVFIPIPIS